MTVVEEPPANDPGGTLSDRNTVMRILLVDDSGTMRNIERKVLEALGGVEFCESADGVEALSVISATPEGFDLILIDWNMPNMDGITLARRIREMDKKTPLMMVSPEAEKARVIDAIQAGVSNFVVMPFTPQTLLEKCRQTLDKARAGATWT